MNVKGLLRHSRDFTRGLSILKNIPIALRGGGGEYSYRFGKFCIQKDLAKNSSVT